MRFIVVIGLVLLFCKTDAFACGDKFLVIGRGMRYDRIYTAAHPASILVYLQDSKLNRQLESTLKPAGHKVRTVEDEVALAAFLKSGNFDLLLVNQSNVARMETQLQALPGRPTILSVVNATNKTDLKTAQSKNICLLKYNGKTKHPVVLIDKIMEAKLKGKPQICDKETK